MIDRQQQRRQLLDRIDALLKEAYSLPKTRESWERREEIDWEILHLCRNVSELSSGPLPYWLDVPPDDEGSRPPKP
ncbi:MAG TPA: hypothetical protein VFG50_15400 [Rhodothermales bacterium]|nr:hypothetical protein [Rhodothermales bacterium]